MAGLFHEDFVAAHRELTGRSSPHARADGPLALTRGRALVTPGSGGLARISSAQRPGPGGTPGRIRSIIGALVRRERWSCLATEGSDPLDDSLKIAPPTGALVDQEDLRLRCTRPRTCARTVSVE
jgi:hypothetical protein